MRVGAQTRATSLRIGAYFILLVAIGTIGYSLLSGRESLRECGEASILAVTESKGSALISRMRDKEIELLGITKANLSDFLAQVVAPSTLGFKPHGAPSFSRFDRELTLIVTQRFASADGRTADLSVTVSESDHGPRLLHLTSDLYGFVIQLHSAAEETASNAVRHAVAARNAGPRFMRGPYDGFAKQVFKSDSLVYVSWADEQNRLDGNARAAAR